MVEHRGLADLVSLGRRREFAAAELSRVLASTSLSFDVSVFEIFGAAGVRAGAVVVVRNLLALAGRGRRSRSRGAD